MIKFVFDITPIGKPRLTQRDKWKNTMTDRAKRYYQYREDLQKLCLFNKFKPVDEMRIVFFLPALLKNIPLNQVKHLPHTQKPDLDNLVKGFIDSLYENDASIYHIDAYKFWCFPSTLHNQGRIEVEIPS